MYRDGSRELQVLNLNKDKDEKKSSATGDAPRQPDGEKCPGTMNGMFLLSRMRRQTYIYGGLFTVC